MEAATSPAAMKAQILDRIRALAPRFRERAQSAEDARRLPEESARELLEAGVARILVPARFGGYELGFDAWFDVACEAGRGDASHGWCASLMTHHAQLIGLFPDEAQKAVWANGPDVSVAGSILPKAQVKRAAGGFRVSGQNATFSSGVNHSSWVVVGGLTELGGPPEWVLFLLAPGEYTVRDTWFTAGMRGTGSNTIVADDVFVPDYRILRAAELMAGTAPGGLVNDNAIFRLPFYASSALTFIAPMLGTARAAYDFFRDGVKSRVAAGDAAAGRVTLQLSMARAAVDLDVVELLARRAISVCESPERPASALAARNLRDFARCGELLVQSIDGLLGMSGPAGFAASSPIQRAWRDIHFASSHIGLNTEVNYTHFGRNELGLPELSIR